jgi:hypothetical protein
MDPSLRFRLLEQLVQTHKPGIAGKILQRLLGLAFDRIGFRVIEEGISEGIDLSVAHREIPEQRYAFEVRTTQSDAVPVSRQDLAQMKARAADGYQTGLAALRIAPGAHWILVRSEWLRPPDLPVSVGTCEPWKELAASLNQAFDEVLEELAPLALREGLEGLDPDLRRAMQ